MIPFAYLSEWKNHAPWNDDAHVEQDLILSRIIVEIFNNDFLRKELAFRGGTALHKLFFSPAARYSEDIDLVRTTNGPIKPIIDELRDCFELWLGAPKTKRTAHSFKIIYYFNPEKIPTSKARIKIEINIKENFSIVERIEKDFSVNSRWFTGKTKVNTFKFEELMATKLRALYQRKKGRDIFDLWLALQQENFDSQNTVELFMAYMRLSNKVVTKNEFEKNLSLKLQDHVFLDDIGILLSPTLMKTYILPSTNRMKIHKEGWNLINAANEIKNKILVWLPEY